MRLIDANALKHRIGLLRFHNYVEAIFAVTDAPTIIDALEAVRCMDCKHGKIDTLYGSVLYHCLCGYGFNKAEHFCSYGERKDNDQGRSN